MRCSSETSSGTAARTTASTSTAEKSRPRSEPGAPNGSGQQSMDQGASELVGVAVRGPSALEDEEVPQLGGVVRPQQVARIVDVDVVAQVGTEGLGEHAHPGQPLGAPLLPDQGRLGVGGRG